MLVSDILRHLCWMSDPGLPHVVLGFCDFRISAVGLMALKTGTSMCTSTAVVPATAERNVGYPSLAVCQILR